MATTSSESELVFAASVAGSETEQPIRAGQLWFHAPKTRSQDTLTGIQTNSATHPVFISGTGVHSFSIPLIKPTDGSFMLAWLQSVSHHPHAAGRRASSQLTYAVTGSGSARRVVTPASVAVYATWIGG